MRDRGRPPPVRRWPGRERRRWLRAPLARRTAAVDHDGRPTASQPSNRRRRRLAFGDDADPRNILEELAQRNCMPESDIRGIHERRGGAGGNLDGRRGAADVHRLCNRLFDQQRHPVPLIERREVKRAANDPVLEDDDEYERWRRPLWPLEPAVRSGPHRSAVADDGDFGVRDRSTTSGVDDLSDECPGGRRCDQQAEKSEGSHASQHRLKSNS